MIGTIPTNNAQQLAAQFDAYASFAHAKGLLKAINPLNVADCGGHDD